MNENYIRSIVEKVYTQLSDETRHVSNLLKKPWAQFIRGKNSNENLGQNPGQMSQ